VILSFGKDGIALRQLEDLMVGRRPREVVYVHSPEQVIAAATPGAAREIHSLSENELLLHPPVCHALPGEGVLLTRFVAPVEGHRLRSIPGCVRPGLLQESEPHEAISGVTLARPQVKRGECRVALVPVSEQPLPHAFLQLREYKEVLQRRFHRLSAFSVGRERPSRRSTAGTAVLRRAAQFMPAPVASSSAALKARTFSCARGPKRTDSATFPRPLRQSLVSVHAL